MRQTNRRLRVRDTVMLSGWLFADLLLALAVIFLAANTVGFKPRPIPTPTPTATPSPTATPVVETPTVLPRLELNKTRLILTIDYNGLLNNSPGAINNLKQQMRNQPVLQGRQVGLVIVYGGAPSVGDIGRAFQIAQKVYNVLRSLGSEGFAFSRASYYDTLYVLGNGQSIAVVDLYLFAK